MPRTTVRKGRLFSDARRTGPPDHDIGRCPGDLQTKIPQLVVSTGLVRDPDRPGARRPPTKVPALDRTAAHPARSPVGREPVQTPCAAIKPIHLQRSATTCARAGAGRWSEHDDQNGHRKRRGSTSGRPVAPDTADYNNHNVVERQYCHLPLRRGLATRHDEHAVDYRAAVILITFIARTRRSSVAP